MYSIIPFPSPQPSQILKNHSKLKLAVRTQIDTLNTLALGSVRSVSVENGEDASQHCSGATFFTDDEEVRIAGVRWIHFGHGIDLERKSSLRNMIELSYVCCIRRDTCACVLCTMCVCVWKGKGERGGNRKARKGA